MKPGDMIEWTYKLSGELVHRGETLWSNVEERFVPIGGEMVHLLVAINDRTYSWINAEGLFHARVDDSEAPWRPRPRRRLFHGSVQTFTPKRYN